MAAFLTEMGRGRVIALATRTNNHARTILTTAFSTKRRFVKLCAAVEDILSMKSTPADYVNMDS
ncbi:MAG: hypothetical protein ACK2T3_15015, partial [Candidatus Promineifilaceae bacterium]